MLLEYRAKLSRYIHPMKKRNMATFALLRAFAVVEEEKCYGTE